jgi:hypothetical protein
VVTVNTKRFGPYARNVHVDKLDGLYAVRGISMDGAPHERAEVGRALETEYRPLIQLQLEPRIALSRKDSYLDEDGFSGAAYQLAA